MYTFLVIVHVIACLALILVVLLQKGKGSDLGAAFGGSSQTVFGSQGAGGFLTKMVAIVVAVFMLTSLSLAYLSSHRVQATVMEETKSTEGAGTRDSAEETLPIEQEAGPADGKDAPVKGENGDSVSVPEGGTAGPGGG